MYQFHQRRGGSSAQEQVHDDPGHSSYPDAVVDIWDMVEASRHVQNKNKGVELAELINIRLSFSLPISQTSTNL